jgi:hypothetical protein
MRGFAQNAFMYIGWIFSNAFILLGIIALAVPFGDKGFYSLVLICLGVAVASWIAVYFLRNKNSRDL